jgi:hypothetical protein
MPALVTGLIINGMHLLPERKPGGCLEVKNLFSKQIRLLKRGETVPLRYAAAGEPVCWDLLKANGLSLPDEVKAWRAAEHLARRGEEVLPIVRQDG